MPGYQSTARRLHTALIANDAVFATKPGSDDPENQYISVPHFTYLGEGCSRTAYLHDRSRVVYKYGARYANSSEYRRASDLRASMVNDPLRDGRFSVYVPEVSFFDNTDMVAMEYADGFVPSHCTSEDWDGLDANGHVQWKDCSCTHGWCHKEAWEVLSEWSGLYDMHWGNALWNPDTLTYFLCDLA